MSKFSIHEAFLERFRNVTINETLSLEDRILARAYLTQVVGKKSTTVVGLIGEENCVKMQLSLRDHDHGLEIKRTLVDLKPTFDDIKAQGRHLGDIVAENRRKEFTLVGKAPASEPETAALASHLRYLEAERRRAEFSVVRPVQEATIEGQKFQFEGFESDVKKALEKPKKDSHSTALSDHERTIPTGSKKLELKVEESSAVKIVSKVKRLAKDRVKDVVEGTAAKVGYAVGVGAATTAGVEVIDHETAGIAGAGAATYYTAKILGAGVKGAIIVGAEAVAHYTDEYLEKKKPESAEGKIAVGLGQVLCDIVQVPGSIIGEAFAATFVPGDYGLYGRNVIDGAVQVALDSLAILPKAVYGAIKGATDSTDNIVRHGSKVLDNVQALLAPAPAPAITESGESKIVAAMAMECARAIFSNPGENIAAAINFAGSTAKTIYDLSEGETVEFASKLQTGIDALSAKAAIREAESKLNIARQNDFRNAESLNFEARNPLGQDIFGTSDKKRRREDSIAPVFGFNNPTSPSSFGSPPPSGGAGSAFFSTSYFSPSAGTQAMGLLNAAPHNLAPSLFSSPLALSFGSTAPVTFRAPTLFKFSSLGYNGSCLGPSKQEIESAIRTADFINQAFANYCQIYSSKDAYAKAMKEASGMIGYSDFASVLSSTGLISSYNSYHPYGFNSFFKSEGSIGGVACRVGKIKNLENDPTMLTDMEDIFALNGAENPFSNEQLKQILRELAVGIFEHNTYPFFSLDFNHNGALYPLIHPVYQNALVGKIIGYLDYYLKGFLNGGVFSEEMLEEWHQACNMDKEFLKSQLIDIKEYIKKHNIDIKYQSCRELMSSLEKTAVDPENPFTVSNHSKYQTAFRIIAKQGSIQKQGNCYLINPEFEVEYTIMPNPDYEEYLDKYQQAHGSYPEDYKQLIKLYETMKIMIHDEMPKLPFCKDYFAMLGVINFFCYYFNSLKEAGQIPKLEDSTQISEKPFPKALPPIPVRYYEKHVIDLTLHDIITKLREIEAREPTEFTLDKYLLAIYETGNNEYPELVEQRLRQIVGEIISSQLVGKSADPRANVEYVCLLVDDLKPYFASTANIVNDRMDSLISSALHDGISEETLASLTTLESKKEFITQNLEAINASTVASLISEKAATLKAAEQIFRKELGKKIPDPKTLEDLIQVRLRELGEKIDLEIAKRKEDKTIILQDLEKLIVDAATLSESIMSNSFLARSSLIKTYKHSVLAIADGDYYKAVGDDTRIKGGCGMRFEGLVAEAMPFGQVLSEVFAASIAASGYADFAPSVFNGNSYNVFKLAREDFAVQSYTQYMGMFSGVHSPQVDEDTNPNGYNALMSAAQAGDLEQVKALVADGAPLNDVLPNGLSALLLAIQSGHEKTALWMVENLTGLDLNIASRSVVTPLLLAIELEMVELAIKLVNHGANLTNTRLADGYNALHLAAKKELSEIVAAIVSSSRLNINEVLASKRTALHIAASKGNVRIIQMILAGGGDANALNFEQETPLMEAILSKQLEAALCLLDHYSVGSVNKKGENCLVLAAKHNMFAIADKLIDRGVDPYACDHKGYNYIYYLLMSGEYQRFTNLVNRVEFDYNMMFAGKSALAIAASNGHALLVDYLASHGAKFISNVEGDNLVHQMIRSDNLGFVVRSDAVGRELAYIAAKNGSIKCLRKLIHHVPHKEMNMLLAEAIFSGRKILIEEICKHISNINAPLNRDGNNLSHILAKHGQVKLVKTLVEKGLSLTKVNSEGHCALHIAILNSDKKMLKAVIKETPTYSLPNDLLEFAKKHEKPEIVKFLLSKNIGIARATVSLQEFEDAFAKSNLTKMQSLIAEIDINLHRYLHKATKLGDVKLVAFLLSHKADPLLKFETMDAFAIAVKYDQIEVIRLFYSLGLDGCRVYANIATNKYTKEAARGDFRQVDDVCAKIGAAMASANIFSLVSLLRDVPINNIRINGQPFIHILFSLDPVKYEGVYRRVLRSLSGKIDPLVKDKNGNGLMVALLDDEEPKEGEESISKKKIDLIASVFAKFRDRIFTAPIFGNNILQLASIKNKNFIAQALMRSGFPIDFTQNNNSTIHIISMNGDVATMQVLLSRGANINASNAQGTTALMLAAAHGNLEMVRFLMDKGADIALKDIEQDNALNYALIGGKPQVALYLLKLIRDLNYKNRDGKTPLTLAVIADLPEIVDALGVDVESLAKSDNNGFSALHYAVIRGNVDIIKKLISKGVDINISSKYSKKSKAYDITPLMLAGANGKIQAFVYLMENGADLIAKDSMGKSALEYASMCKDFAMCKLLSGLPHFQVEKYQNKMLFSAARNNNTSLLRELFFNGASFDYTRKDGANALHLAALGGASNAALFLIESGVSPTLADNMGNTPLHYAAMNGSSSLIKQLAPYANIDILNAQGESPLFLAAKYGKYSAVIQLLKSGADFSLVGTSGLSPAQQALINGHVNVATLFIIIGDKSLSPLNSRELPESLQEKLAIHSILLNTNPDILAANQEAQKTIAAIRKARAAIVKHALPPMFSTKRRELEDVFKIDEITDYNEFKILMKFDQEQEYKNYEYYGYWDATFDALDEEKSSSLTMDEKLMLAKAVLKASPAEDEIIDNWGQYDFSITHEYFFDAAIALKQKYGANILKKLFANPTGHSFIWREVCDLLVRLKPGMDIDALIDKHLSFESLKAELETLEKEPVVVVETPSPALIPSEVERIADYMQFKKLMKSDKHNRVDGKCWQYAFNALDSYSSKKLTIHEKLIIAKAIYRDIAYPALGSSRIYHDYEEKNILKVATRLKDNFGINIFRRLFENPSINLIDIIEISSHLLQLKTELSEADIKNLLDLHLPNLAALKAGLEPRLSEQLARKYPEQNIDEVLAGFASVEFPLKPEELARLRADYIQMEEFGRRLKLSNIYHIAMDIKSKKPLAQLAIIREVIRLEFGIYPHACQMLAVMSLINKDQAAKGRIAEVLTGEGKATIIAMLAVFNAISYRKVDVITSSRQLAERDRTKFANYYKIFGITSSHIGFDIQKREHFDAQIIYGTNYDFEFSILREQLGEKQIRYRDCDIAIIDEIDSMLLDGQGSAQISLPAPTDKSWIYELLFRITAKHPSVTPEQVRSFFANTRHKNHIYLIKDSEISMLVSSAKKARELSEGKDYEVILCDETGKRKIVIVDFENTGRMQHGSQWSQGLHQFVEVKHGIKPNMDSLTSASISHPAFFLGYKTIYGLTGTVGERQERKELEDIYHLEIHDVPPHLPRRRTEKPAMLLNTKEEHNNAIIKAIRTARAAKQSVLVLFKTIKESEKFAQLLKSERIPCLVLNEKQTESEDYILLNAGKEGAVTIATNTAGRGTDINAENLDVILTFMADNQRVEDQGKGRTSRQGRKGSCQEIICLQDEGVRKILSSNPLMALGMVPVSVEILKAMRSQLVAAHSKNRYKRAIAANEIFEVFNRFSKALIEISNNIKHIEPAEIIAACKQFYPTNAPEFRAHNQILTALYKQAYSLIALQKDGVIVDWEGFINSSKEQYLTYIKQTWAKFYTDLSVAGESGCQLLYEQFIAESLGEITSDTRRDYHNFIMDILAEAVSYHLYGEAMEVEKLAESKTYTIPDFSRAKAELITTLRGKILATYELGTMIEIDSSLLKKEQRDLLGIDRRLITLPKDKGQRIEFLSNFSDITIEETKDADKFLVTFPLSKLPIISKLTHDFGKLREEYPEFSSGYKREQSIFSSS